MYKNGSHKILHQDKLRGFGRSGICFQLRFKNRSRVNVQRNTGKAYPPGRIKAKKILLPKPW